MAASRHPGSYFVGRSLQAITDTCNGMVSSSHVVAPQFDCLRGALLSQRRKDIAHNTVNGPASHFAQTDLSPFVGASNTSPKSYSTGFTFVARRLGPA